MNTDDSSFIRDRTNLDKAHELNDQANKAYNDHDYSNAVRLYHQCLLNAKAVCQLSASGLQAMARSERESGSAIASSSLSHDELFSKIHAEQKSKLDENEIFPCEKVQVSPRCRIDSTSRGEEMKQEAASLIAMCYINLSACIVNGPVRKRDDYMRAVYYCDKVLEFDSENQKAILRKGYALKKAEDYESAIDTLKKCEASNEEARELIEDCRMRLSEDRRKRDAAIRANFAKVRPEARNGNVEGMNGNALNGNVRQ